MFDILPFLAYCYIWHLQIFVIFAFVSFLQFWCSRHFGMIVVFVILALSHFGSLAFLHFVISAFCYLDMSKFSYLVIWGRLTFCSLGILIFNNCGDYWFWHFVSRDVFACSTFRSYLFWVKHSWHVIWGILTTRVSSHFGIVNVFIKVRPENAKIPQRRIVISGTNFFHSVGGICRKTPPNQQ